MLKIFKCFLGLFMSFAIAASALGSAPAAVLLSAEGSSASYQMKEVYEPETSIIAPPTVITKIDTEKKLNSLNTDGKRTQVASFEIADSSLNVSVGDTSYTIAQIFDACATAVIPMFTTSDSATAEAFANYVVENEMYDVMLASDNTDVLLAAHGIEPCAIRYAYLAGAVSEENSASQIALDTHIGNATIAIISQDEALSRDDAEYLQLRGIAVWLDSGVDSDKQRVFDAVDCGANGVTVENFNTAYNLYGKVKDEEPVSIRKSFIVGHRGAPTAAPENSLASYEKTISLGGDAIETDVWMLADGSLICNHNGSLDGYTTDTTAKGLITRYTWDELSQYTLKAQGAFDSEQFCKLEWLFELLQKNPDIITFLEIKDTRREATKAMVKLMEDMKVEQQVFFISFGGNCLEYVNEFAPYCGTGYLTSPKYSASLSVNENLKIVMDSLGGLAATADYIYGTGDENIIHNADFVKAAAHRGILMQAWTISNEDDLVMLAKNGVTSITTNYPTWSKNENLHTYESITAETLFPADYTVLIICICAVVAAAVIVIVCVAVFKSRKKKNS